MPHIERRLTSLLALLALALAGVVPLPMHAAATPTGLPPNEQAESKGVVGNDLYAGLK